MMRLHQIGILMNFMAYQKLKSREYDFYFFNKIPISSSNSFSDT